MPQQHCRAASSTRSASQGCGPWATQEGAQLLHLPLPEEQNLLGVSWPEGPCHRAGQLLEAKEPLSVGSEQWDGHKTRRSLVSMLECHVLGPLTSSTSLKCPAQGSGQQGQAAGRGVPWRHPGAGRVDTRSWGLGTSCCPSETRHPAPTGVPGWRIPRGPGVLCQGVRRPGTVRSRRGRGTMPCLEPMAGPSW